VAIAKRTAAHYFAWSTQALIGWKQDVRANVGVLAEHHILVVEDDPATRAVLDKTLTAHGYSVTLAGDGLSALELIEADLPSLAIVDIMVPRLDGLTFVEAIKRKKETKEVPVIFLTSKNDPLTMTQGIKAGAKFYLTKPFRMDELLDKIRRALG
jgi:DNA-binding response OmpR family regulator